MEEDRDEKAQALGNHTLAAAESEIRKLAKQKHKVIAQKSNKLSIPVKKQSAQTW